MTAKAVLGDPENGRELHEGISLVATRPTEGEELGSMASVESCSIEADILSGTLCGGEKIQKIKGKIRCGESLRPRTRIDQDCAGEEFLLKGDTTPNGI